MIVAKFGGSSLANAAQFQKVKSIVRSDPERRFIVPSAPGKEHAKDDKITDLLYECHHLVLNSKSCKPVFNRIRDRYLHIAQELSLDSALILAELEQAYVEIEQGASRAFVASRGEYLCGILLAQWLDMPFVDAAKVMRFCSKNGQLDQDATNVAMAEHLASLPCAVVPGFYGADENNEICTFSRGGSDVSGALVARGVNADLYENWTDISGFRTADPRIIPDSKFIQSLTYRELRELSYMGASVLHEDAVFPVRIAGIPTQVRNTNDPLHPGTMIHYSPVRNGPLQLVTGIAGLTGFSSIQIEKDRMNAEIGFGRRVLQVFEDFNINFEHLPTGIDAMSVILSSSCLAPHRDEILNRIQEEVNPDYISIQEHIAMVAIVGCGMVKQHGTAARLFTAIAEHGISIKTMLQTPGEMSIIIGVDEKDYTKTIMAIYDAFIRT